MGFDKFEWIRLVVGDRRLKVAERFVLTNAAIKYVRYGDDVLRVRQTTVAEQFAVGVRTVRAAISQGRELGYLVLAQPRHRGRSYHGPDEHRLVIPANAAAITEVIPAEHDPYSGTDRPEYRQNTTGIPAEHKPLTSQNADPKGFLKGSIEGIGGGGGTPGAPPACSGDAPLPEIGNHPTPLSEKKVTNGTPSPSSSQEDKPPNRYCTRHPEGTDDPCGGCGEARRTREAWEAEQEARSKPRNHNDAYHPETWKEWTADLGMSEERPTNYYDAKKWDTERDEWKEWNADLRAKIKACTQCDNNGQYTDHDGLWWCEHTALDCPLCDDYGWQLGPDGSVKEPAKRCSHPKPDDPVAAAPAKQWPAWRGQGPDPFEEHA